MAGAVDSEAFGEIVLNRSSGGMGASWLDQYLIHYNGIILGKIYHFGNYKSIYFYDINNVFKTNDYGEAKIWLYNEAVKRGKINV